MPRMDDGYQTLIDLGLGEMGTIFWEKEPQPPGWDAGGPIDTTTMRNSVWRTRIGKSLTTLTEMTILCAYDPAFYSSALGTIGSNRIMTVLFPTGFGSLDFWGFLDKVIINPHKEGEQPTMSMTIVPTNQDLTGAEVGPVFTA